jgi:hypothetical protein
MIKEETRTEVRRLLKECATEGTFWNRHLKSDDVIDLWRETNRILTGFGEEPLSFDVFYLALEKFKMDYINDFESAVKDFVAMVEEKPEVTVQWKPEARAVSRAERITGRAKRTRTGKVQVTSTFNPEGQRPIEMTLTSAADDWARLVDYFNRNHDAFIYDFFYRFLARR